MRNSVSMQEVLVVKQGQTAIIYSDMCDESFCFSVRGKESVYSICRSSDVDYVKRKCKQAGLPSDFIIADTNNEEGVAHVINAYSQKGVGIAVQEKPSANEGFELKLAYVNIEAWKPYSEQKENGLEK